MTEPREKGAPYERAPALIRAIYPVWRSVLNLFGLLGDDGRPSDTKLAGTATVWAMLYICVKTLAVPNGAVALVVAGISTLFGRAMYGKYLRAKNGNGNGHHEPPPPPVL